MGEKEKLHAPTFTGPHTPETRAKIAAAIAEMWQDPDFRSKVLAAERKAEEEPDFREKKRRRVAAAFAEMWQDPDFRNRMVASHKKAGQRPDVREKNRDAVNVRWSNPEEREQQRATAFALWQDPNFRLTVLTTRLLRRTSGTENAFGLGVRPESVGFLTLASSNGTWKALEKCDRKAANLIRLYFRTEATVDELATALHIKPHIVRRIILKGIGSLWQQLPPELQEQFPLKAILRFKITQTPKTKEKMRKSAKARLAQKALNLNEEPDGDLWEPEREAWVYAREHDLLPLLVIAGYISLEEGEILRRFFERDNNNGPIKEPNDNVLDRFTIGVANLACG